jgi:CheY-like chemotaxis protein
MAAEVAYDGNSGQEKAAITRYDVVVLDRDLPGMSGDEVCADIAGNDRITRVIMLTASGALADKVEGLTLVADDDLAKPFDFGELVARMRALARRATPATPPVLTVGDVVLDPARRTVRRRRAGRAHAQGVRGPRDAAVRQREDRGDPVWRLVSQGWEPIGLGAITDIVQDAFGRVELDRCPVELAPIPAPHRSCPGCQGGRFSFPGALTEAVSLMCPGHQRQAGAVTQARLEAAQTSNPDGWGALGEACERLERPHVPNGLVSRPRRGLGRGPGRGA